MTTALTTAARARLVALLPSAYGADLTDDDIGAVVESRKLDSFILAMQSETGRKGWAHDFRWAAGLCTATWREEALWNGLSLLARGTHGRTHLMYAAYAGDVARIHWLLKRGAALRLTELPDTSGSYDYSSDGGGRAAIHWAAAGGHVPAIEALLNAGAEVDMMTSGRQHPWRRDVKFTPLMYACEALHVDAVRFLLLAGANPRGTYAHSTPLEHAIRAGDIELTRFLLAAMPDMPDPLQAVVASDSVALIRELAAAGADVSACGTAPNAETPLCSAVRSGSLNAIRELFALGADVNTANAHGRTALHVAAGHDRLDLVELLLAAGADQSATDNVGRTAQMCLSRKLRPLWPAVALHV